jgi:hypothetical protein
MTAISPAAAGILGTDTTWNPRAVTRCIEDGVM